MNSASSPNMSPPDSENAKNQSNSFRVHRIYVKDLSFEAPETPAVFLMPWKPSIQVDVQMNHTALEISGQYEVVLTVLVTARLEAKTAFIVEVKQAGIFTAEGFQGPVLDEILGPHAANILYPYVRHVISNAVIEGGFPAFILSPINFGLAYKQQQKNETAT